MRPIRDVTTSTGELVRATGLCSICDYKFVDEIVARYPARSMPGGWSYIQIRHLDADEIKALRVLLAPEQDATRRTGRGRTDPLVQLAAQVRARRIALGLTQEAAGHRAHMDMSYWSRIERAAVDPGVRTLARLATALETTAAELMTNVTATDATPPPSQGARRDPVGSRDSWGAIGPHTGST
jgi:hypothetical protein